MTYEKLVRAGELYRALQEEDTVIESIRTARMPLQHLLPDEAKALEAAYNEFKEKAVEVVRITNAKYHKEFEEL